MWSSVVATFMSFWQVAVVCLCSLSQLLGKSNPITEFSASLAISGRCYSADIDGVCCSWNCEGARRQWCSWCSSRYSPKSTGELGWCSRHAVVLPGYHLLSDTFSDSNCVDLIGIVQALLTDVIQHSTPVKSWLVGLVLNMLHSTLYDNKIMKYWETANPCQSTSKEDFGMLSMRTFQ